jgi:Na+/proline symporter
MTICGLYWLDILIVLAYLVGALSIGRYLSKRVKGQTDFYLAGRKLGKAFQFFLNFGNMTDSSGATQTASVVYKDGVGGVWISFQTLLMTPYYWFMNVWFRRVRLFTVADLFEDRFGGRFLSGLYASFVIYVAILAGGWGNLVAYKTIAPMMIKSADKYTKAEAQMINDYSEFIKLRQLSSAGELLPEQKIRYEILTSLYEKGQLKSYVSYLNPIIFYIASGTVVAIYIIMGGLTAAAIIDAMQALLTVAFSVILIPFGMMKLGGFGGMHTAVPDYMFRIFGSEATSEFTWYSILAILLTSIVQIHAIFTNMGISGSAKDELAARLGAVSGGFGKRFIIIAWTMCALIAVGLYGKSIGDPDNTWGILARDLLPVGAIGVMLSGILAAKMASLGSGAITLAALFTRNLYMPLLPDKGDKHYVFVGRITIAGMLISSILVSMTMTDVVSIIKALISMNVTFGAPILLIFFWRRLTKSAVSIQVISCIFFIVIIPYIVTMSPTLRRHPLVVKKSVEHTSVIHIRATDDDVSNGLAAKNGQLITKTYRIEPQSLFFEGLAHSNPQDVNSPMEGLGRFNSEVFLAYLIGFDVQNMKPAGLLTTRFLMDGILPFVMLIVLSYVTKPSEKIRCDRFYVRLKTPIALTPEEDAVEIEKSYANPQRYDHLKIFRKSNWEMCKWNRQDTIGFLLCWVMVAFILGLFFLLLNIGR